jgi:hypothetical protein
MRAREVVGCAVVDAQTLVLLVIVYFAPTLVARGRYHPQAGAITVVNVFLGWTLVGWVVALAMACSAVKD